MRLLSYKVDNRADYGVVLGEGVVSLGSRLGHRYPDLQSFIAEGDLGEAREILSTASADHGFADVRFDLPVPAPEKIWCIGVNYCGRNEEYRDHSELPKYPSLFARHPGSLVGHGEQILRPRVSEQLDYEGEIVIVIGKEGRHIPRDQALSHIYGLTLCNEGTVRDWLRHGRFNVTQGKNFHHSGSIGPWIVSADELSPASTLEICTRVNGEIRQRETTGRLIFPFDFLITYLSTFAVLKPGDMIATGTPTGAGARFDPPRWLIPGDVVEVECPGIGTLRNTVAQEA